MHKAFAPFKIAVLIGGNGSNLQALIDHSSQYNYQVTTVISHNPEAYGIQRALNHNIPVICIDAKKYTRAEFDAKLIACLTQTQADLIVLAGFMRILSPEVINSFAPAIINIHPSLLPKYKGLHTHRRVLEAKDPQHGCSVHYVTAELDSGQIIAQATLDVLQQEDESSLQARVHHLEHHLYPTVVSWFANHQISLHAPFNFNQQSLPNSGIQFYASSPEKGLQQRTETHETAQSFVKTSDL